MIFTDDPLKRFEDFVEGDFDMANYVLGIKYQKREIHDDTVLLLRYNCPEESCDVACFGWPDLHRHVRNTHHKVMCDLCTRNKKVFTHEHDLYTNPELRKHERFGDDNPGAIDQSGFKGHPECGFCRQRFYGDDELFAHCRDKHEKCHICERRLNGRQPQYYLDYNALEEHFRKDHFLCFDKDCLDKKFVVFESEMDLKGHQLEAHPNGLSKDARRDARRVDISSFDYRTPHNDNRGGRARGRGRDPNSEPLPPSTAQPMRRDEIAYQRQMAIQSSQSVTTRSFGGQLSSNRRDQEPITFNVSRSTEDALPNLGNLTLDAANSQPNTTSTQTSTESTPREQARQIQHNAVLDRASSMLHNDPTKISDFRSRVSSYRASAITAQQLIETFFTLFDASAADVGKLVKALAEIYESESKRSDLLRAWNDWRAVNEDYPSLPGPVGGAQPNPATTGRRILKLKSSTAQSSRSAVNRQEAWGNAAAASSSATQSANRVGPGRVAATPWATPSSSSSSRPAQSSSRPAAAAAPSISARGPGTEAFPALPAAAKPNTQMFGLHRGAVRWDDRSPAPANPWGGEGASARASTNASANASDAEVEEGMVPSGKKKAKKKQTLYRFG